MGQVAELDKFCDWLWDEWLDGEDEMEKYNLTFEEMKEIFIAGQMAIINRQINNLVSKQEEEE